MTDSTKIKDSTATTHVVAKGFEIRSYCGRVWFLPLSAVRQDYIDFLKDADKLTQEEAELRADHDPDFFETWFAEQFDWRDVDRLGEQIKEASLSKVLEALNHMRASSNATDDYTLY